MLQLHEPGEGRAEDEEDEEEDDEDPELEVQSELSISFKEAIVSLEEVQKFLESRGYLEVSLQWTLLLHCKLFQLHSGHYFWLFFISVNMGF